MYSAFSKVGIGIIANVVFLALITCKKTQPPNSSDDVSLSGIEQPTGEINLGKKQESYSDPALLEKIDRIFFLSSKEDEFFNLTSPLRVFSKSIDDITSSGPAKSIGEAIPQIKGPRPDVPNTPVNRAAQQDIVAPKDSVTPSLSISKGAGDTVTFELYGKKLEYTHKLGSAFDKNYEHIKIKDIGEISFKDGEDSAFLLVKADDDLAKNILDSPSGSIVRGTTEYRILKTGNELSLVHVLNVKPVFDRGRVFSSIETMEVVLPSKTFRSDLHFLEKQSFVRWLGQEELELTSGATRNIEIEGVAYLYKVSSLGAGSFGDVYRVEVRKIDTDVVFSVAIKQSGPIYMQEVLTPLGKEQLISEVTFLDGMSIHPNALQFYGAYHVHSGYYNIVMEFVEGDWNHAIRKNLDPATRIKLMIGAADGIAALHAAKRVHYDLKPGNLLYSGGSAKLGDFGFAREIDDAGRVPGVYSHGSYVPFDLINLGIDSIPGNPFNVDVFAAGIAMLELRMGRQIWGEIDTCCRQLASCCQQLAREQQRWVINGNDVHSKFKDELEASDVPNPEIELLGRMLSNDPLKRPTMLEVAAQLRKIRKISNL